MNLKKQVIKVTVFCVFGHDLRIQCFPPALYSGIFTDGTAVLPEWYQPHLNGTPLNSWVHEADDPMDCCCCGVVKLLGAHPELVGDTKETLYGDVGNMAVFHNLLLDE